MRKLILLALLLSLLLVPTVAQAQSGVATVRESAGA